MGNLEVFSNKNTPKLETTALVPNYVHVVLMNYLAMYRRWLLENKRPVVGLLLVRVCSDLKGSYSIDRGRSSGY